MQKHRPTLTAYAYQLLGNYDAVQDVLQRTWIALFDRLTEEGEAWPRTTDVRVWLRVALYHAAIDHLREQRRTLPLSAIAEGEWLLQQRAGQFEQPDMSAARNELNLELDGVIHRLSPPIRAAIVLHFFEGYNEQEIAQMLGRKLGTVKSDLHRGKHRLRYALRTKRIEKRDLELWTEYKENPAYLMPRPAGKVQHAASLDEVT